MDTIQSLYYCMSNSGPSFKEVLFKAGHKNCYYFAGGDIDPENTGSLQRASFKTAIDRRVPNKDFDGILILDDEGKNFQKIKFGKDVGGKEFKDAVDTLLNNLKYAKSLRPKAQWGYYDIPMVVYYVLDSDLWRKRIDLLDELIGASDVLMPSIYDYYPDGIRSAREDSAYIIETLKNTLKKGKEFDKKVLPFIWHRYADSNPATWLKSIDSLEFFKHLSLISSVDYQGKKVDGVIWWQEDLFFINTGEKNIMKEMGSMPADVYRDRILTKYYKIANQIFKN